MELYEQIRREYEHGAGTIRAVARKLGVHRREVRKALASAVPAERKIPERDKPKLAVAMTFIDGILEGDRKAPRSSGTRRIGSPWGMMRGWRPRCGVSLRRSFSNWDWSGNVSVPVSARSTNCQMSSGQHRPNFGFWR